MNKKCPEIDFIWLKIARLDSNEVRILLYLHIMMFLLLMKRFCIWLPTIILLLIPIAFFMFHACGYEVYIVNGEKYPWIVNSEELLKVDSLSNNSMELLMSLKRNGLVLSPQEYTNHTYNFFSWLLTILVAVIGIVVLVFGLNVDKKIETIINSHLKTKWLELMRIDKEVDATIGGIIDDKIGSGLSDISHDLEELSKRVKKLEDTSIRFETTDNDGTAND